MKKITFLLLLSVFINISYSRDVAEKGVLLGLNVATFRSDYISNKNMYFALCAGGYAMYALDEQFYIRGELFFSMKGALLSKEDIQDEDHEYERSVTTKLNYLELPVLGVLNFDNRFELFAGPYVAYFIGGQDEEKITENLNGGSPQTRINVTDISPDDLNNFDFGVIIGGAIRIGITRIEARYSIGFINIYDETDFKNTMLQVLGGIYF